MTKRTPTIKKLSSMISGEMMAISHRGLKGLIYRAKEGFSWFPNNPVAAFYKKSQNEGVLEVIGPVLMVDFIEAEDLRLFLRTKIIHNGEAYTATKI